MFEIRSKILDWLSESKELIRVWNVVLLLFSMADKFILYVRKFLKNPLLARKQVVSTLMFPVASY